MFVGRKDNPAFETWGSALGHIADRCPRDKQTVFVFNEFPYAAIANPSLPSTLQIAIDHAFKSANLMLTLCGSNEGFMESEVLGYKSPPIWTSNHPDQTQAVGLPRRRASACRQDSGRAGHLLCGVYPDVTGQ